MPPTLAQPVVRSRDRVTWLLGLLLALVPAAFYLKVLSRHAVNIPRNDDYVSILRFLSDWSEIYTWADRLALLTEQYYNHRIAFTRLVALLQLWFSGETNLIALQAIGWIGWAAFTLWLAFSSPITRERPWLAFPVIALLMHPQGYSNMHSAMQALQNIPILVVALGACAAATRPSRRACALAVALGVLAPLVSANGLLVLPVVAISMAIARSWQRAAVAGAITCLVWYLYLIGFDRSPAPFSLVAFLLNAGAMTGGFASVGSVQLPVAAGIGGVVLLASAGALSTRLAWRALPGLSLLLVFLLLSVAMTAFGRIDWGADYMLQDRYRLYGLSIVAILFLLALEMLPRVRGRIAAVSVLGATGFMFAAYATCYAPMLDARRWCEASAMTRQLGPCLVIPSGADAWREACNELARAARLGYYRLPALLSPADLTALSAPFPNPPSGSEIVAQPSVAVLGALLPPPSGASIPLFGIAVMDGERWVLPVSVWRATFRETLGRGTILSERHFLILPGPLLRPGRHAIHAVARARDGRLEPLWSAAFQPSAVLSTP